MTVKHLDHLNLTVGDLSASIDWYRRVFGFEVQERGIYNGAPWAIIKSGEAMLCMYEHPDFEMTVRGDGHHRVNHFALRIDERDAWEQTVEREGLELYYGGEVDWPHSTAWYVKDPTGYDIEVALWSEDRVVFDDAALADVA